MSADLAEPYRDVEAKLKDAVAQLLRRGNHQLLSGMLHALLAYPDYPYDWKTIGYVDGNGGPTAFVAVTTPPTLDRNTLWPKERKLLEILAEEKAQGRQGWIFCTYTSTHPVLGRLEKIIQEAGYTVKVLDADKVPTRSRSAWIARNAPGVDVIISHPQPVRTGLTLFDAMGGHNFPTLAFYETGYDLFTLRQASRRSWRIGQRHPCRVYYLYYKETMQARAMGLMAQKLDASLALEGQFSAEGLAAMSADSGSLTMELAKSPRREHRLRRCRAGLGEAQRPEARSRHRTHRMTTRMISSSGGLRPPPAQRDSAVLVPKSAVSRQFDLF